MAYTPYKPFGGPMQSVLPPGGGPMPPGPAPVEPQVPQTPQSPAPPSGPPPGGPPPLPTGAGGPNLQALQQIFQTALGNPGQLPSYVTRLQQFGLTPPDLPTAQKFATGQWTPPEDMVNQYHSALKDFTPPASGSSSPFIPHGQGSQDIGAAIQQWMLQMSQEDRPLFLSLVNQLQGIKTPDQLVADPTFGTLKDKLYGLAEEDINKFGEDILGYIPGISKPPTLRDLVTSGTLSEADALRMGDLDAPVLTKVGSAQADLAGRGGIRALRGPNAAVAASTTNEMMKRKGAASESAYMNALQAMMSGNDQRISALGTALENMQDIPSPMRDLIEVYMMERKNESDAALAALAGGGGGGGGGGGSKPSSGLSFPLPSSGGSSGTPSWLAPLIGAGGTIAAASVPALIEWLRKGGKGTPPTTPDPGVAPPIGPSELPAGSDNPQPLPWVDPNETGGYM